MIPSLWTSKTSLLAIVVVGGLGHIMWKCLLLQRRHYSREGVMHELQRGYLRRQKR
jgi:hypothetical protein